MKKFITLSPLPFRLPARTSRPASRPLPSHEIPPKIPPPTWLTAALFRIPPRQNHPPSPPSPTTPSPLAIPAASLSPSPLMPLFTQRPTPVYPTAALIRVTTPPVSRDPELMSSQAPLPAPNSLPMQIAHQSGLPTLR